jgi:hypothetical protein
MKRLLVALLAIVMAVVIWKDPFGIGRGRSNAVASQLATTFSVVNSGTSAYVIDSEANPELTLNRGETYIFNVTAVGHPFFIKTARVTGSGSQYNQGVTGQGVQSGQCTFVVPGNAPSLLFYQCGTHSAMGGNIFIQDPVGVGGTIPPVAWLGRAVPNPASNGASFRFGLPRDAQIEIAMFDARGRRVRKLWNGPMTAGEHAIQWDGRDEARRLMPSGPYFFRLRVEGRQLSGRLFVAR